MFLISPSKIKYALLFLFIFIALGKSEIDEEDEAAQSATISEPDPADREPPPGMEKLTFKAANLSEEDHHSGHMPLDLICDGCRIIAYQMKKSLEKIKFRFKKRKGYTMSESDLIDLFDELCKDQEIFNTYGVKDVNGKKRLSGDGLETKDVPGMMAGGGKWPSRLQEMCLQYVGNLGEEVIYAAFKRDAKEVEKLLCYSEDNGNVCNPKKKKKKASKRKEEL